MRSSFGSVAVTAAVVAFACVVVASAQDAVQLTDGRFVTGPPMTRTPNGVVIHYKNGDVTIPKTLVREAAVSKVEGVEPDKASPEAAEKIAQGLVNFEGKWLKKDQVDKIIEGRKIGRTKKIKEAMDHREWRNRYTSQTENFAFEYTIDQEVMKGYSELMEVYFKRFTKEWKITRPAGMGKLKVCFYHDEDTFHQVGGASPGVLGYFKFVKPEELNFFYDRTDEELTMAVMFHETNHYLTHLIDPTFQYPIWINESLAEYYGASKWDPKTKTMDIGRIQDGRLAVIQDHILGDNWQKLDALMRLKHGEFDANHYAWGWSFVHYLMSNKKYAEKFKAFYIALAKEKGIKRSSEGQFKTVEPDEVQRVLMQYLGVKDIATLEKEWHEYIKSLKQTSAHGLAEAGELFLMFDAPLKAQKFLKQAIEKGDDNAKTWFNLARTYSRKSKYDEAADAMKKAIERDPLNGLFYLEAARAEQGKANHSSTDESTRLKQLALEVEPDNFDVIQQVMMDEAVRKKFGEEREKSKGGS